MAVTTARTIVSIKEKGRFQPEDERVEKYTLGDELPAKLSELHLRARPMQLPITPPAYSIRVLGADDKDQVLQFLIRWFFRDEPMNQAVQLLETPESRCVELEEYAAATLYQRISLAAVDAEGRFVAILINGIVERKESEKVEDKSEDCSNEKFQRILRVLSRLDREARVWSHLPEDVDKLLEVRIASVDSQWRGRNLMRVLCEESERMALERGVGACRMDATSKFSAAAAERLGYRAVYRMAYADEPDAPQPAPPHTHATVYIKLL